MEVQENNSSWKEWAKYVLKTLEELKLQGSNRDIVLNKLIIEIKVMQTKMTIRAGLTGALAAMIPVTIALIIWLITKDPSSG